MRLIEAGPKYGAAHQGYQWLLLAQVNGGDVDTRALSQASKSLSAEEHLAVRLRVEMAVGKNLSSNWPRGGVINQWEKWEEESAAALRWQDCEPARGSQRRMAAFRVIRPGRFEWGGST